MHLCECLLSLMKQPHENMNIKKPKFQELLTSSMFLLSVQSLFIFFTVNLPFPIYFHSDDLIGLNVS